MCVCVCECVLTPTALVHSFSLPRSISLHEQRTIQVFMLLGMVIWITCSWLFPLQEKHRGNKHPDAGRNCGAAAVQVWSAGVPDASRVHKAKHLPSPTRASFANFAVWPLHRWDMYLGPQPGRRLQHQGHQHPCIFITAHAHKEEERKTLLLLGTKYWVN